MSADNLIAPDADGFRIAWSWIADREGGRRIVGYVPQQKQRVIGQSGVTIATGFDLGQHSETDLRRMGISTQLVLKLRPYLGLRTGQALSFLALHPLVIDEADARELDEKARRQYAYTIVQRWDARCSCSFRALPWQLQTVMVSLGWNYGPYLDLRQGSQFKRFYRAATDLRFSDLPELIRELESPESQLRPRRELEAELVEGILTGIPE